MSEALKEACQLFNQKEGYDTNCEESLYETFIECLSEGTVQKECESEHRWYDIHSVVHQVTIDSVERYFQTFDYHITGDNSASDMDLRMPTLDGVFEVFPHEVTTTIYK